MTNVMNKEVLRAYLEANRMVQATQNDGQIMPIGILNTFLGVAVWGYDEGRYDEPITLERLAERLNIMPTTLSTHLRYLADKYRAGKPGPELVEMETYQLNRRQKIVRLTDKGKRLAQSISYIMEGVRNVDKPKA
jgi:predicted transcriptional regulator